MQALTQRKARPHPFALILPSSMCLNRGRALPYCATRREAHQVNTLVVAFPERAANLASFCVLCEGPSGSNRKLDQSGIEGLSISSPCWGNTRILGRPLHDPDACLLQFHTCSDNSVDACHEECACKECLLFYSGHGTGSATG